MRFGENLRIVYQLPVNLEQMKSDPVYFADAGWNAIKHNIVSGKKPLTNFDQQIWEFYRGEKITCK